MSDKQVRAQYTRELVGSWRRTLGWLLCRLDHARLTERLRDAAAGRSAKGRPARRHPLAAAGDDVGVAACRRAGCRNRRSFPPLLATGWLGLEAEAQGAAQAVLPWLAGQFVMGAAGVVDQILLAHMPSGNLAAYGYANRVMALTLTLSATVIGRAFLPVLAAEADERLRLELTRRWAKRFFWLGALGAAALMWVAEPAVALLFERGNFTRADTAQTSALLRLMALQWLLYLVGTVWVQWTLARGGRLSGLLWAALAGTGAKLAVSLLLVAWLGWGAEAICAGLAAATVGYWLALKASVWRCIVKVGG